MSGRGVVGCGWLVGGGNATIGPCSSVFPLGEANPRTAHYGVTLLYGPSICARFVQMDPCRSQVRRPFPTPGCGTLWVAGGALAGQAWLLSTPMDGVLYPQPLTRHETQYVPSGVPCIWPVGHPPGPMPPWAAGLRPQAYPASLRLLMRGWYGH